MLLRTLKIKLLIISFIFTLSFSSVADVSGLWVGKGTLKTKRNKLPCDIYIDVSQSENSFNIHSGGYVCEYYNVEYPASEFTIADGKLFYNGEQSGTVSKNSVNIKSEFESGNWFYLTITKKKNGKLSYEERWEVPDSELYVISDGLVLE